MNHSWLHDLNPVVVQIAGSLAIRWYGLSYVAGFVLGWLILRTLAKRNKTPLTPDQVSDLLISVVAGVILGGRFGYALFYQPSLLWSFTPSAPWWGMLRINEGGMSSHGGMIGVVVAAVWFYRRLARETPGSRPSILHLLDLMGLAAPAGLLLGRLANFINGELLGRIVALPGAPGPWWAVKFPQELVSEHDSGRLLPPEEAEKRAAALRDLLAQVRLPSDSDDRAILRLIDKVQHGSRELARGLEPLVAARHPSQLYQAAAEGLVLGVVVWTVFRFSRRPGVVAAWWLMTYGVLRIATEFWRLPDGHLAVARIAGLSRGQWLSALMVLAGAAVLFVARKCKPLETPTPQATG